MELDSAQTRCEGLKVLSNRHKLRRAADQCYALELTATELQCAFPAVRTRSGLFATSVLLSRSDQPRHGLLDIFTSVQTHSDSNSQSRMQTSVLQSAWQRCASQVAPNQSGRRKCGGKTGEPWAPPS